MAKNQGMDTDECLNHSCPFSFLVNLWT